VVVVVVAHCIGGGVVVVVSGYCSDLVERSPVSGTRSRRSAPSCFFMLTFAVARARVQDWLRRPRVDEEPVALRRQNHHRTADCGAHLAPGPFDAPTCRTRARPVSVLGGASNPDEASSQDPLSA